MTRDQIIQFFLKQPNIQVADQDNYYNVNGCKYQDDKISIWVIAQENKKEEIIVVQEEVLMTTGKYAIARKIMFQMNEKQMEKILKFL